MSQHVANVRRPVVRLTDPDERPLADVVIYDGECQFCRAQVERLARCDGSGKLAFISLHDSRVADRYPDLTHEQLMQDMYVVDRQGRRHCGAAALRHLSCRLPPLWPLAPWLHLPWTLPLWQGVYRQVAKRRYWWGKAEDCATGSCRVHGR
jgi:predicted DCC family thiol-disulfide oxidoreductase YuxK